MSIVVVVAAAAAAAVAVVFISSLNWCRPIIDQVGAACFKSRPFIARCLCLV